MVVILLNDERFAGQQVREELFHHVLAKALRLSDVHHQDFDGLVSP